MQSKVESLLLSPDFDYLQPYFYNHPYALRCELGIGRGRRYMANARRRAKEIYRILFPHGADAIAFNAWIYDRTDTDEAWKDIGAVGRSPAKEEAYEAKKEAHRVRFLLEYQRNYRHVTVKNLRTYCAPDDPEYENIRRNRVLCYAGDRGFDDLKLLRGQIDSEVNSDVSLVSFENECILSVYDDRGCDVVFADPAHFRAFYPALEPYFLAYDLEEMQNRLRRANQNT